METRFHFDGRKTIVENIDDVEPILERNKELRSIAQKSDWGRHVASIPNIILTKWLNEEWAKGNTTLAFHGGTFRLDFDTIYLLASRKQGKDRYTTRIERFHTRSHQSISPDASKEQGKALTASWLHDINEHWRGGLEYVRVDAERPGIPSDGNSIIIELRVAY